MAKPDFAFMSGALTWELFDAIKANQTVDACSNIAEQALRDAFNAGLERAAEIADESGIMFADAVADAIRAEKEVG